MHITCPKHKVKIEVENLEKAIKQANEFRHYIPISEYQRRRKKYWESIYKLLINLKNKTNEN